MEATEQALLALWREAGRHADAIESLPVVGETLRGIAPLDGFTVFERRRDAPGFLVLGEWRHLGQAGTRHAAIDWGAERIEALERWATRRELAERPPGGRWLPLLLGLEPEQPTTGSAAGPLLTPEGTLIGLVLFSLGRTPEAAERALLRESLEPLAAIVGNDYRLREIGRLSARAEAERDSLLSRLGRESLAETVVGADAGLAGVMARVDQVARTNASVLILGETGSGKEVIARAIHDRSARHGGPFIRVNCGAVAPELIDSELFGHEKGSFTGAVGSRRGWFERASGGTLFLDEIGELSPAVQVRLLRVLQDGVVQRVGSEAERTVDVRVITATHRDLPQMVQEREFREDLWYRIAVFPIILPPLRERRGDLPALARHFIHRAANRAGLHEPRLTEEDVALLAGYDWPGNVRELGAVIERAVILGQGERLALGAALGPATTRLPRPAGYPPPEPAPPSPLAPPGPPGRDTGASTLDAVIRSHIRHVVDQCGGRLDGPHGAARVLGLNVNTLRSKMRKLGMRRVERD